MKSGVRCCHGMAVVLVGQGVGGIWVWVMSRLLSSVALCEILTGSVHIRVT